MLGNIDWISVLELKQVPFCCCCYRKIIVDKSRLTVISLIYWDIGAQMIFIYWDVKSQTVFKLSSELKSNENSHFFLLPFSFVRWVSLLLPEFIPSFRNCMITLGSCLLHNKHGTWKITRFKVVQIKHWLALYSLDSWRQGNSSCLSSIWP